jgi:tRNA threonylcarbamoyl adenosine modification protein YeaZ
MIVLALDTAGADCSACLYDSLSGVVLGDASETIGKGHAERLMGIIDIALDKAGLTLKSVERIAVSVGPGSFTGIRVGVSAARGFALSLGVEAVGVSTLEVLGSEHIAAHPGQAVTVVMDARRGEVYLQSFSADGSPADEPAVQTLETAMAAYGQANVTGSASALLRGGETTGEVDRFPIATVARLGAGKPAGASRPKPLYLRGVDAKPQAGFALERRTVA